jgi:hypothetical protein
VVIPWRYHHLAVGPPQGDARPTERRVCEPSCRAIGAAGRLRREGAAMRGPIRALRHAERSGAARSDRGTARAVDVIVRPRCVERRLSKPLGRGDRPHPSPPLAETMHRAPRARPAAAA